MIYHLSLQTAGFASGLFLLLLGLANLILAGPIRTAAPKLPRSMSVGVALFSLALLWSFWLLATMEMGEFSSFRRPLLFILPVGFVLVILFVKEFLAARALGILCLLAAEPLLEAAFLRYETSRLLVVVFAYIMIVAGLFWVTMPYLLRDQIGWSTQSPGRWKIVNGLTALYGVAILVCTFTRY